MPATRTGARLVLAAASVGAGAIHLAHTPAHMEEYLPLGIGFVAAGALQLLLGLTIAFRDSTRVLLASSAVSAVVLLAYVVSRTTGLPFGPEAFEAEALGTADVLCFALEVPVVLGGLLLALRRNALRTRMGRRALAVVVASLALVGTASGIAVASPEHEHAHGHEACPAAPVITGTVDERGVDTGVTAYFRCRLENQHGH
jgi:hypothetical protein